MKFDWLSVLIHGTIALSFGIVREIYDLRNESKKMIVILTNGLISLFVGVTVYFLCKSFDAGDYLTAFFTSVSGWLGGSLMEFFGNTLKKIIDKKVDNL